MSASVSVPALQPLIQEIAKLLVQAVREELTVIYTGNGSSTQKSDTMLVSDVMQELKVGRKKVNQWIRSERLRAVDLNPSGSKRPRFNIERADFEMFRKSLQPTPMTEWRTRKPRTSCKRY